MMRAQGQLDNNIIRKNDTNTKAYQISLQYNNRFIKTCSIRNAAAMPSTVVFNNTRFRKAFLIVAFRQLNLNLKKTQFTPRPIQHTGCSADGTGGNFENTNSVR